MDGIAPSKTRIEPGQVCPHIHASPEKRERPSKMFRNTPPRCPIRIGRVRRGIQRAFIAGGGRDLTTSELLQWSHALELYRGASLRQRHYYCQWIRQAALRLCERVGRSDKGSGRPVLWRLRKSK